MVYCSYLSNIVSAWWGVHIKWTVMNNNYKEWITELNWKNKGLSGCSKGVSENAKISIMLKITLLYGYNCSYAVLRRVQCKEYNLQFMLLCNSCIYFAHAIKMFDILSFSLRTIRLFSAGLLSAIIWWRRLRTMKYGMKVTTGETLQDFSPTSRFITCLFGCTTTQQGTLFFQMNAVPSLELTLPTEGKGSSLGIDCTCCSSTEAFKKWPMTKALLCLIGNGLKIKKPAQFVLKSILASPMWPQAE